MSYLVENSYGSFSVGDLENDEGDEDESENENAVTDSEDEDEHYQGSSVDIVKELQVGCMKNVDLGQEASPVDEECEPMLEQSTTVDFHGKGLKGELPSNQSSFKKCAQVQKLIQ